MNVVDSSGWLEYFANGPNAYFFAPPIENLADLVVPTLSLYEVFKRVLQQAGEDKARQAVATMAQGKVIDLDTRLALNAANLSIVTRLPLADSVILATAQAHHATLWSQDGHIKDVPDVRYIEEV